MRTVLSALLLGWLPAVAFAETVRIAEDIESQRFADGEVAGPTFVAGATVRVLVRENHPEHGEWLRVRDGDSYGWIPADVVEEELASVEEAPLELQLD